MADQSPQTTTNTPSEPVLCKLGCGFFGNAATGWFCSKCWRDVQKTANADDKGSAVLSTTTTSSEQQCDETATDSITIPVEKLVTKPKDHTVVTVVDDVPMSDVTSSDVVEHVVKEELKVAAETVADTKEEAVIDACPSQTTMSAVMEETLVVPPSANLPVKQKKKKKNGYKQMMAGMMHASSTRDVKKETDDAIRKVTGGGTFTKIDKI